jgi:hypothetical protein
VARYGVSQGTAIASRGAAAAFAGIRAGASPITVYEMAIFAGTAAAAQVSVIRALTPGTASTQITPVAETAGTPLARLDTAWSSQPTITANSALRSIGIPSAIGNGYTFIFPDGILVPASGSLLLWSLTAASPTTWIHAVFDE